jgi:hypothetical protein
VGNGQALSPSPMGVGTPGCLQQVKPPGAGFFRFRGDHCWGGHQAQPRGVDHAVPPVVVRDALSSSPMGVGTPGCAPASRGAQSSWRWAQAWSSAWAPWSRAAFSGQPWVVSGLPGVGISAPVHSRISDRRPIGASNPFAFSAMAHCNALKAVGKSLFEWALISAESSAPRVTAKGMSVLA